MKTFVDHFQSIVRKFSKRPAFFIDDVYYNFEQLDKESDKIANLLLKCAGENTIILSEKSPLFYFSVLAAFKAGKGYIPINSSHTLEQMAGVFNKTGAKILVADQSMAHILDELIRLIPTDVKVITKQTLETVAPSESSSSSSQVTPESIAYIFMTSGSTGVPKYVPISHKNLMAYLESADRRYRITEEDRFTQISAITFDVSIHDIVFAWYKGACTYAVTTQSFDLVNFVQKHQITFWCSVPSVSRRVMQTKSLKPNCMPSLRHTMWIGEPLSATILDAWKEAAPNSLLENMYGPTEATVGITGFQCPRDHSFTQLIPIGQPYYQQETKVVDVEGRDSTRGELFLAGSQVFDGYLNHPEANEKALVQFPGDPRKWYKTGDIVEVQADGNLMFLSRKDDQLKINGYRIERSEIEEGVRRSSQSQLVAVLPLPAKDGITEGTVAFVDETELTQSQIRARFKEFMPPYMWPLRIELVKIPLNRNHKTDYKALENKLKLAKVL